MNGSPDVRLFENPDDGAPLRTLPYNVEAEKALLGAIITDNRAHEKVSEFLLPEHFAIPEHGRIFGSCCTLISREQTANTITLEPLFENDPAFAEVGGIRYLAELVGSAVTIINSGEYGRIIYEAHLKRELIHFGEGVVNNAFDPSIEITATEQIEHAERFLSELAGDSVTEKETSREDGVDSTLELLQQRYNDPHALLGASTGLTALDKILLGLEPPDLLVLAGRPSMGKTALAQKVALFNALKHYETEGEEGTPVGLFSMEMSIEQLNARFIADLANVPLNEVRSGVYKGNVTEKAAKWEAVVNAAQLLKKIPLFIDDRQGVTASTLRSRTRHMKRRHGIGLAIYDQLSHIRFADPSMNPVRAIGQITKEIKAMNKELEIPSILLHQLSRAVEQRDPPRPLLGDLRDSGEIEQDADVVMFAYREQYYLERKEPSHRSGEDDGQFAARHTEWMAHLERVSNKADVIVAKQRMGDIGVARVHFHGPYTRFSNLAEGGQEQQELI